MYFCPNCNKYIYWKKKERICTDCRRKQQEQQPVRRCERCWKINPAEIHTCTPGYHMNTK